MSQDLYKKTFSAVDSLLKAFLAITSKTDRRVTPAESFSDLRKIFAVRKLEMPELEKVMELYVEKATQVIDPRFMGHQVSTPHPAALLGDVTQSLTNNSLAVHDMGAAGIAIERNLIDWFLGKMGWSSATAGGILTHGGSLANLTALLAARGNRFPKAWKEGNSPNTVLIAPETAHYCVNRSASMMGFGSQNLRLVKSNSNGSMNLKSLQQTIETSLQAGEKICAVVATAACTATGVFDSLSDIAQMVKERGLWLHIDGAHGAPALLSRKHAHRVRGIELADSLVWDAHKMMRSPNLCTAVLFRDRRVMENIFSQDAPYLSQDTPQDWELRSPFAYTVECTRSSLGLKFYPVLCAMGDEGLEKHIDESFELAQAAIQWIRSQTDFEAPLDPESNIVVFRLKGLGDDGHLKLYNKILADGGFHVTYTRLSGHSYLRLSLMNPATTLETIKELLRSIRRLA